MRRWSPVPVLVGMLWAAAPALATPACPISYGATDNAKPNKLYVYFPTSSDSTFPEFSTNSASFPTSPVQFDPTQLTSYTGTASQLRNGIFDVVSDDYCEFNVQVRQTTTAPPTTFARRNTVAVGTDSWANASDGRKWGQAQTVDTGDATLVDFARAWAGTYNFGPGLGTNSALTGANATLTRWATSIGGTTAHEAGHSYGVGHDDGLVVRSGEDVLTHHVMAKGSNYTDEQRAGYRRHFSDNEMSILAANVGLSIQTMHNWDLVNPNSASAKKLRMTFLAPSSTVTMSWAYDGDRSPWSNPSVSGSLGTQSYKGTTYHKHTITWSTGKSWTGGSSGTVPGGGQFHVGATFSGIDFNSPDPIIITKTELLDASNAVMALAPRLPGYDAGTLDADDGSFDVTFDNLSPFAMRIQDVIIRQFPRILSIDSLVPGGKLFDVFGQPLSAWEGTTSRQLVKEGRTLKSRGSLPLTLARLANKRHIFKRVGRECQNDDAESRPDVLSCRPGYSVDLFPATTTVVQATVVLPAFKHWVRAEKRYVTSDVKETIFFQVGGVHPDLNRNRRDDAIDIATGKSIDENRDGVPDEAQKQGRRGTGRRASLR